MFYLKNICWKNLLSQKPWIFIIRLRVEKANWHCKKQYQRLDKVFELDKTEKPIIRKEVIIEKDIRKYNKSNLYYDNKHNFTKNS